MEPTTSAALIGSGAQLLGRVLGGSGEDDARKWNAREAAKARQFSERMRNTQWQAAVADMQAAGLNPALAYAKGPAASPSGSQASGAQSKSMQGAQMANLAAQTTKTLAEARSARAQAKVTEEESRFLMTQRMGEMGIGDNRVAFPMGTQAAHRLSLELERLGVSPDKARAEVSNLRARTRREGATADMLRPMADLANNMGMAFPLLSLFAPGGFAGNIARRMPIPKFGRRLSSSTRVNSIRSFMSPRYR